MPNLKLYQYVHNEETNATFNLISNITNYEYYNYIEKDNANVDEGELIKNLNEVGDGIDIDFWEFIINYDFKNDYNELYIVNLDNNYINLVAGFERSIQTNTIKYNFKLLGVETFFKQRIAQDPDYLDNAGNFVFKGDLNQKLLDLFYNCFRSNYEPAPNKNQKILFTDYPRRIQLFNTWSPNLTTTINLDYTFRFNYGSEILQEILDRLKYEYNTNYRIYTRFNPNNNAIDFYFDETDDKSDFVKFSLEERKNMLSNKLTFNNAEEKTIAIVGGDGDGVDKVIVSAFGGFVDLDPPAFFTVGTQRKELFLNADDISNEDENGNPIYTPEEYEQELVYRGAGEIAGNRPKYTFEFEALEKEIDFQIGDIVEVLDDLEIKNKFNGKTIIKFNYKYLVPVAEINKTYEKNTYTIDLKLGEIIKFETNETKFFKTNLNKIIKK